MNINIIRYFFLNATAKIEEVDPALAGFLGGANLPIIFSWLVGGFFAGGVAFVLVEKKYYFAIKYK